MSTAFSIRLLGLLVMLLALQQAAPAQQERNGRAERAFSPGETWLDTKANRSTRTAGHALSGQDYYWYGENKVGRSWMPKPIEHGRLPRRCYRIRCYSSKDLYHWKDRG